MIAFLECLPTVALAIPLLILAGLLFPCLSRADPQHLAAFEFPSVSMVVLGDERKVLADGRNAIPLSCSVCQGHSIPWFAHSTWSCNGDQTLVLKPLACFPLLFSRFLSCAHLCRSCRSRVATTCSFVVTSRLEPLVCLWYPRLEWAFPGSFLGGHISLLAEPEPPAVYPSVQQLSISPRGFHWFVFSRGVSPDAVN